MLDWQCMYIGMAERREEKGSEKKSRKKKRKEVRGRGEAQWSSSVSPSHESFILTRIAIQYNVGKTLAQ